MNERDHAQLMLRATLMRLIALGAVLLPLLLAACAGGDDGGGGGVPGY
jgi:hypothetical protein